MKLFADECVYSTTVNLLHSWGQDIVTAQEAGLAGKPNEEILAFAIAQKRVLITIDMDFSNIRHYLPKSHTGIIVMKIRPRVVDRVHAVLQQLFKNIDEKDLNKSLIIVDQSKYRIR